MLGLSDGRVGGDGLSECGDRRDELESACLVQSVFDIAAIRTVRRVIRGRAWSSDLHELKITASVLLTLVLDIIHL